METDEVIRRLREMESAAKAMIEPRMDIKQGDVAREVLALMQDSPRDGAWTFNEIYCGVRTSDIKAVRNAITYLEKCGYIIRPDRGEYRVVEGNEPRPPSRKAAQYNLLLRAYADMFELARQKIEELQEQVRSQMCATCEQRNVDEAAGINYKAGEY